MVTSGKLCSYPSTVIKRASDKEAALILEEEMFVVKEGTFKYPLYRFDRTQLVKQVGVDSANDSATTQRRRDVWRPIDS